MYRVALFLLPAVALCGARYARLGEVDGKTEVLIEAADPWQAGVRNMPLPQSARVQTGADSHAEVELDDGSVVRLAPDTLIELSDYTSLSGGQRLTLVSLDHGMYYYTGQAGRQDAVLLVAPGAQVSISRGTRLRLEAREHWSQIAVIEGNVRFASPSAEMDLSEGEMARVDPVNRAKFYLYREISSYESDRWSEERDKLLASSASSTHVPELHYGVQDLDSGGTWIDTESYGPVWKPKTEDNWTPFRDGKWAWYEGLGYTWIGADSWGWLPYHYGRWMRSAGIGWFWVPGRSLVFKPGEVYWLRGAKLAGWGPLAPGEEWSAAGVPQLFLNASTNWAPFAADARVVDPAGFTARPKEPLAAASFAPALPSPAYLAARLDAVRPPLRTGAMRILPVISSVWEDPQLAQGPPPPPAMPRDEGPPAAAPPVAAPPPDPPPDIYYPVPVYTGIVVINPPDTGGGGGRQGRTTTSSTSNKNTNSTTPAKERARPHRMEDAGVNLPHRDGERLGDTKRESHPATPPPHEVKPQPHEVHPVVAPPAVPAHDVKTVGTEKSDSSVAGKK